MSDYGVTEKGFVIKRLDVILDEIHSDLTEKFKFNTRQDPQSFLNVLVTTFGGKVSELWEVAQNSYYAKYPSTAEGASLDNAVQYGGIKREKNSYSYYKLHCKGEDGTTVRQGAVVATNTAPQMKLNAVSEFEITRDKFNCAEIRVAAESKDSLYSVSVNGVQYSYTSTSEDALEILKGLAAVTKPEGYMISVDEANLTLSIVDETVSRVGILVLSDNLTTASVTVIADFATNEYSYDVPRCNTLVCGTYPRRATVGSIMEICCENDVNAIIAAFESSPTGTIRIGGKAYNATLGDVISEDIEIEINSNLQIVDVLKAGVSVAGVNPEKAIQGMVIPKDILVDGKLYTENYKLPATGRQTTGGGELADVLSVGVQLETSAEALLSVGTATQIAASPSEKCGTEYKIVSVLDNETESSVNVYIATAKVRRCGTVACGNKE